MPDATTWTAAEDRTLDRAAKAWCQCYLWAMEQPNLDCRTRRIYDGPIADDILAAGGITLTQNSTRYRDAVNVVIERGYKLAGGKIDNRGIPVSADIAGKAKTAIELRHAGHTLKYIARKLGMSVSTVYKVVRRHPKRVA